MVLSDFDTAYRARYIQSEWDDEFSLTLQVTPTCSPVSRAAAMPSAHSS
jgi:hypothetical protein